jgi:hypothetical protein
VVSKRYIELLRKAILDLHGCESRHVESVPVHEVFRGQTVWRGDVDVFELTRHPKAKRAYAWSYPTGPGNKEERFVAVLKLPPVKDPKSAVKVAIVAEAKKWA